MSFPFYLRVGPLQLSGHWLLETLGYAAGFWIYRRERRRSGDLLPDESRWWVIAAAAVGAVIGGKILYWFEDPQLTLSHWNDPAFLIAGKTIVGALVGGLFAVEWEKKRLGIRTSTGDLFAVPLCIGMALGRVGCFLAGLPDHTFGKSTALPWGVNFGDGIPRHPTQLYEALFLLLFGALLWRWSRRPHVGGDIFKTFMVGYMTFRLLVDFLKPDVRLAELSSIQWCCLAMLMYYHSDIRRWLLARRASPVPAGAGTS